MCFPVNIANILRTTILKCICKRLFLIVVFSSNEEQRSCLLDEMRYEIIMFYVYSFYLGIIIFVLHREASMEVLLKKVFLKISKNLQGNTCTGVSFLSAASNCINEKPTA